MLCSNVPHNGTVDDVVVLHVFSGFCVDTVGVRGPPIHRISPESSGHNDFMQYNAGFRDRTHFFIISKVIFSPQDLEQRVKHPEATFYVLTRGFLSFCICLLRGIGRGMNQLYKQRPIRVYTISEEV